MINLSQIISDKAYHSSILQRKAAKSVIVNDIAIPTSSLISRLHVFGHNLAYYTKLKEYEIQLIGSATGVEYGGRHFIISTKHQVKGIPYADVGIILPEKPAHISSAGCSVFSSKEKNESDLDDLIVFDYEDQCRQNPGLVRRFFKLNKHVVLVDSDNIIIYIAYGCPFSDQNYDIYENNRIDMTIRPMICEAETNGSDISVGTCRTHTEMKFDPNGLSGGPVFAVTLTDAGFALKFAGIINRAGNGIIHFIKSLYITSLIDHAK